jgi:hypothetical protein
MTVCENKYLLINVAIGRSDFGVVDKFLSKQLPESTSPFEMPIFDIQIVFLNLCLRVANFKVTVFISAYSENGIGCSRTMKVGR